MLAEDLSSKCANRVKCYVSSLSSPSFSNDGKALQAIDSVTSYHQHVVSASDYIKVELNRCGQPDLSLQMTYNANTNGLARRVSKSPVLSESQRWPNRTIVSFSSSKR